MTWMTVTLIAVAAVVGMHAAYRNGFSDGVHWMCDETYPSRPRSSWWAWGMLTDLHRNNEAARQAVGLDPLPPYCEEHGFDCCLCHEDS